jgi:hypothetical protein
MASVDDGGSCVGLACLQSQPIPTQQTSPIVTTLTTTAAIINTPVPSLATPSAAGENGDQNSDEQGSVEENCSGLSCLQTNEGNSNSFPIGTTPGVATPSVPPPNVQTVSTSSSPNWNKIGIGILIVYGSMQVWGAIGYGLIFGAPEFEITMAFTEEVWIPLIMGFIYTTGVGVNFIVEGIQGQ